MEQPRDSIPQNSQDRQVTSAKHPQVARPTALPVSVNHIPAQLRTLPQWVCWQYEYQPKRSPEKPWTKVPINPQTGKHASSTNPKTWGTFEEALRHYQKLGLDGIGVVVTARDDLVGVDLDHVRDPETGDIAPRAQAILDSLRSYAEVSPSGTGFRIFTKGKLPAGGRKKGPIEMYERGRFLTVTGAHLDETPTTVEARQQELEALHTEIFTATTFHPTPNDSSRDNGNIPSLADDALIERALAARNGQKFARLWSGDTSDYPSPSEADLALCALLVFWTRDEAQLNRLFQHSGLYRSKWDEVHGDATYGQATIRTALSYAGDQWTPGSRSQPRQREDASGGESAGELPLSDQTNAETLVRWYGKDLHYCYPWKSWLVWDGQRWVRDETGQIMRWAKQTIKRLAAHVEHLEDEQQVKAWLEHIKRSLSTHRLKAMVESAQSERRIPVLPTAFDVDPWRLNCLNGTLDLRTGRLHPHRREDLLTKQVPVNYDAHAICPGWDAFLYRIMGGPKADADGNEEALLDRHERATRLMAFLQRAIGYSLTGDTSEQCLFLLHGPGANGKSTFLELILALLGDYAQQTEFSTFLDRQHDPGVRNDVAELRGARFVSAIEAAEGKRLAEVLVKQLTGGDTVKARFLYQEFFEFKPQFKLFLAANHKPVIRGTDYAIWRRIRLVPFTVTIPKEERDKKLAQTLRQELPGILRWAVQGCLAWQNNGLREPDEVIQATDDYRKEMDVVGDFIDECCTTKPYAKVRASALYAAYCQWCDRTREHLINQRSFGLRLAERGFQRQRGTAGAHLWVGIGLSEAHGSSADSFQE